MSDLKYTSDRQDFAGATRSDIAGGGDFMGKLNNAVRDNPVSAAMIGMGVLWLFMGGNKTSLFGGNGRNSVLGAVGETAGTVSGAVLRATSEAGSSLASAASSMARGVVDTVSGAATGASDLLSRSASRGADTASSVYSAAADAASGATSAISNTSREAVNSTTRMGGALRQNLADLFESQPLVLGAVGLAIGAGIAASLPRTGVEKQVMGKASDFVHGKVAEATSQVKQVASAALAEAQAQI